MAPVLAISIVLAVWCLMAAVGLLRGGWQPREAHAWFGSPESIGDQAERWLRSLD